MMIPNHLKHQGKNNSITSIYSQYVLGTTPKQKSFSKNFHMPVKKLPPPGKYYVFQKYGKSYHAAQCTKSGVFTKVIDTIPEID